MDGRLEMSYCFMKKGGPVMKFLKLLLLIILALAAGYLGASLHNQNAGGNAQESVYDRVMRTKTIRCGYALWPPSAVFKDPNSGELKGAFVDIANEAAANMGLKIDWAEETGWGSFIESLESDRIDMFCAPLWRNAERGVRIGYTVPLAYSALNLYTRVGDTRFDDNLSVLNDAQYRLATMDGEMSAIVARKRFPKAQTVDIPQLGDITQLLLSVADGKADGVFLEPSLAKDFADKNPGKIRQASKEPVSIFPIVFGVKLGETKMQGMLDSALTEMLNQGRVDEIIAAYEKDRSIFMPVAKPYIYVQPALLR